MSTTRNRAVLDQLRFGASRGFLWNGYTRSHNDREEPRVRRIGVREFKDHATAYLSGAETLVIERRGKPVGFFVPIEAKDRKAGRAALRRLDARVANVLRAANLSEEEFVEELEAKPKAKRRVKPKPRR
jgi:hypothetical protein